MKILSFPTFLFISLFLFVTGSYAQNWKQLNPPANIFNNSIQSIAIDQEENMYAAGKFKNTSDEYIVAKWDGTNWLELGSGNNSLKAKNEIHCIVPDKEGNIYAAGSFTNRLGKYSVAKWDGISWTEVGGDNSLNPRGSIYAMTIDDHGNLFAAGGVSTDTSYYGYVAKWDGSNWAMITGSAKPFSLNGAVYSLVTDKKGIVYAAGDFKNQNGKYYVAAYDGTGWEELGINQPLNANESIRSIQIDSSGTVYAGGGFTNSTGNYFIAKWNGEGWIELGDSMNYLKTIDPIDAFAISKDGAIYTRGSNKYIQGEYSIMNLMKWDGDKWNEVFEIGYYGNNAVRTIITDETGNVFLAGDFKNNAKNNYILKWDGMTGDEFGFQGNRLEMVNGIYETAVDTRGIVYAAVDGGAWGEMVHILAWDGKTWKVIGGDTEELRIYRGKVRMITDLTGNLYVGGNIKNKSGKYYIAKWDGQSWSELGNPNIPIKIYEPITLMTTDNKGYLFAAGTFGDDNGFGSRIMKWNGTEATFYDYNNPTGGAPCSIAVDSVGNVYTGNTSSEANDKYYVIKTNASGSTILGTGDKALGSGTKITALAIDKQGNLIAGSLNNGGWNKHGKFAAKWDGENWSAADSSINSFYKEGYITSMISDRNGNVYATSLSDTKYIFSVALWDGIMWKTVGSPDYFNTKLESVATDTAGNIYATGFINIVVKYEVKASQPETPKLSLILNEYCQKENVQMISIMNFPHNPLITVSVFLDNTELLLAGNSFFNFKPFELSAGAHTIKVLYKSQSDSSFVNSTFNIVAPVTPKVYLEASTTRSSNNEAIILRAKNIQGGGRNPRYVFFKDPAMNVLLQAESIDSILKLETNQLTEGINRIYVKMRTSENCYSFETTTDSIDILRVAPSGISDPDFPDQISKPFPNPFQEEISINGLQITKSYKITLLNAMGTIVYEKNILNSTSVKIKGDFKAGIYWLKLYDNTEVRLLGTSKIVKL